MFLKIIIGLIPLGGVLLFGRVWLFGGVLILFGGVLRLLERLLGCRR